MSKSRTLSQGWANFNKEFREYVWFTKITGLETNEGPKCSHGEMSLNVYM